MTRVFSRILSTRARRIVIALLIAGGVAGSTVHHTHSAQADPTKDVCLVGPWCDKA